MTPGEVREAIAAAATTVDGITCNAYYKTGEKPGTSYVELLRTDYPNQFGGEDYWGVVVILDNDLAAAQKFMDDHRGPLRTALMEELVVTQVRPEIVPLPDNPGIKTMVVEGHRETAEE